jgi:nicotinate-nucleotide adenylyltransferase
MKIGILGGSFDPVHYGHLLLAESCRDQCQLDEVRFLPAAAPPHKLKQALSSPNHRVAMCQLAIAGHPAFRVSTQEVDRGGVSYTVQTLRDLHRSEPESEFFLLMGADSLRDLPDWRETEEVCRLAVPVVVRRRGSPEPDLSLLAHSVSAERLELIRRYQVEMPIVEFSSTAIREAVSQARTIRYQTPRAVEKYIVTSGLYQRPEPV